MILSEHLWVAGNSRSDVSNVTVPDLVLFGERVCWLRRVLGSADGGILEKLNTSVSLSFVPGSAATSETKQSVSPPTHEEAS